MASTPAQKIKSSVAVNWKPELVRLQEHHLLYSNGSRWKLRCRSMLGTSGVLFIQYLRLRARATLANLPDDVHSHLKIGFLVRARDFSIPGRGFLGFFTGVVGCT